MILATSFQSPGCELPEGERITVGCTYDCDIFYRFRLTLAGLRLGYPLNIINLQKSTDLKESLKQIDGVLIPGGADIDPKYYLDSVTPELRAYTMKNLHLVEWSREGRIRDNFEYSVVKHYSSDEDFKTLPMLGICRGLQMMSVAQGIPLYLDIKTELGFRNRRNVFDKIIPLKTEKSIFSSIYQDKKFRAFKLHHQGIRVPYFKEHAEMYPQMKVTAFSNNNTIAEALEYTHRPALGIQYHPERSFSYAGFPVFKWFLTKACVHKNKTSHHLKGKNE